MALFSLSYFSTFTGMQRLNDKPIYKPALKMMFDIEVAEDVEDILTF